MSKPSVIILGGIGFIGRHLVTYLVEKDIASKIRVVDKVLPATAYLNKKHQEAIDKVEFKQANLVSPAAIEKAFARDDGSTKWDWVINLAAETKYSQAEEVYEEKVYLLSVNCAKQAAKDGAKVFLEVSTAQVYDADKKASKEDSKIKPWTGVAKAKAKAEEELRKIPGLNLIIVRPAVVYGVADTQGITPRLIVGAVYKELKEEMKFLWTKDLRVNTVHVSDVVRAIVFLCEKGCIGQTFNLVDEGDTDQEKINEILRKLYGIETGYQGTIVSNLARLSLKDVTEEINDKHLQPWSDLCKKSNISNSPLTPYLDQELLYNNSLSVDGHKITELGFKYEYPQLTEQSVREIINGFVETKIFPSNYI